MVIAEGELTSFLQMIRGKWVVAERPVPLRAESGWMDGGKEGWMELLPGSFDDALG